MTPHEGGSLRALAVWSCPMAYGKEPSGDPQRESCWVALTYKPCFTASRRCPSEGTSTLCRPCQSLPRALQINTPRPRQDSPPWRQALRSLGRVQGDNRRSSMEITALTLPPARPYPPHTGASESGKRAEKMQLRVSDSKRPQEGGRPEAGLEPPVLGLVGAGDGLQPELPLSPSEL